MAVLRAGLSWSEPSGPRQTLSLHSMTVWSVHCKSPGKSAEIDSDFCLVPCSVDAGGGPHGPASSRRRKDNERREGGAVFRFLKGAKSRAAVFRVDEVRWPALAAGNKTGGTGASKDKFTRSSSRPTLAERPLCPSSFARNSPLLSGFSQQYIGSLEHGRRNPTVVTLFELAAALGVSYVELIGR